MRDVLILGMHRSGTSAVAGALRGAGLNLGLSTGFFPAAAENPRGFFENASLSYGNDVLLRFRGGSWDRPPTEPWEWTQELRWEAAELAELWRGLAGSLPSFARPAQTHVPDCSAIPIENQRPSLSGWAS